MDSDIALLAYAEELAKRYLDEYQIVVNHDSVTVCGTHNQTQTAFGSTCGKSFAGLASMGIQLEMTYHGKF